MEKRDPVGVPQPTRGPEVGFNLVSGVLAQPPRFFSRVELQSNSQGSAGSFPTRSDLTGLLHFQWYMSSNEKSRASRDSVRSSGHLLAPSAVKFQCIEDHRQEYPIQAMCRVLEVSVSGFYAWKHRPLCPRKREDGELAPRIEDTFVRNRRVYGSPRIHADLRAQGIRCSRKRVVGLMQTLKLSARRPKQRVVTTKSDPTARFAPNLLQRNFVADAPDKKWVADVTFIATGQGWL